MRKKLKGLLPSPSDAVATIGVAVVFGVGGWELAQPGPLKLLAVPLFLMGIANMTFMTKGYNTRLGWREKALDDAMKNNDYQFHVHEQEMAVLRNDLAEAKRQLNHRRLSCPECGEDFTYSTEGYDDYLCESCRKRLTEDK